MQTEELNILRTEGEICQLVTSDSKNKKIIIRTVNLRTRWREKERRWGITCHRRRTMRLSKRFLLLLLRVSADFLFLPYSVFGALNDGVLFSCRSIAVSLFSNCSEEGKNKFRFFLFTSNDVVLY